MVTCPDKHYRGLIVTCPDKHYRGLIVIHGHPPGQKAVPLCLI
jgi:hypothetical protein